MSDMEFKWEWDPDADKEEEIEEEPIATDATDVKPEMLWTEVIEVASDLSGNADETAGHIEV